MSQHHFHSSKAFQNFSDYTVIDIINYGSFGACYKVKRKSLNRLYVWKAIDFGAMSNHDKKELQADIKIKYENALIHSNILRYYGTIIHEDSGTLYAIMEYCHCADLNSLINLHKLNQQPINEKFIWKVLYQTSKAIAALHGTVSYLNIKPSNIFLDAHYNIKMADFGLQRILLKNIAFSATYGNIHYPSPEQIRGSTNEKTDIWALGCLIHELCVLQSSFVVSNVKKLKDATQRHKLAKLPIFYTENLHKIVTLLINFDDNSRPSVDTIIHHPTVICSYDRNATPFQEISLKSEYGRNKGEREGPSLANHIQKDEINADNEVMKSSHQCVRPHSSLFFDPKKITEDIYNEKFFNRLKLLRVKETALKMKENNLKSKELYLNRIETDLVHKQKLIEKQERKINVLPDKAEIKSNTGDKVVFKTFTKYKKYDGRSIDLDSTTCSADPGDLSVMPTAVKLDPSKIIKPYYFQTNIPSANIEQTCVNKHSIANLPSRQLKKSKSCGTFKKYKQLILKNRGTKSLIRHSIL